MPAWTAAHAPFRLWPAGNPRNQAGVATALPFHAPSHLQSHKQVYVERLAETIARFLGRRSLLALQRPDVGHTMLGLPAKVPEEAASAAAAEAA